MIKATTQQVKSHSRAGVLMPVRVAIKTTPLTLTPNKNLSSCRDYRSRRSNLPSLVGGFIPDKKLDATPGGAGYSIIVNPKTGAYWMCKSGYAPGQGMAFRSQLYANTDGSLNSLLEEKSDGRRLVITQDSMGEVF